MIDTVRCEVYNASYEPLNPVSVKRALRLILQEKATLLEGHPEQIIKSGSQEYPIPIKIVMNYMVKGLRSNHVSAPLTNKALFTRDGYKCQYCGRHKKELRKNEILTRDHVHPKDLGGVDEWTNVVTACNKCNNRKANKTLDRVGMKLLSKPYVPTRYEIINKGKKASGIHEQ